MLLFPLSKRRKKSKMKPIGRRPTPMCKPTMQDIADALSTSRVSVWKVLNNRPGVSDLLRHQIWKKARELGYLPPGILAVLDEDHPSDGQGSLLPGC